MVLIQETYTNIDEIKLSDYATTQYVKDAYQSYAHLNKYYI